MATPTFVDYGNTVVDFGFQYDTKGMRKGDTRYVHFSPQEVLDHVGVVNADLINPHKMEITSTKTNGLFGISTYHNPNVSEKDWTPTGNRVALKGTDVDAVHHHVNIPNATFTNEVSIRPDYSQTEARNQMTNRKAIPLWAGMTSANVKAGVYVSKLGDQTRYIVTPGASDANGNITTKSAMHSYITRNARNPNFAKGFFSPSKCKTTIHEGKEGYIVPEEMYKPMGDMISDMVKDHSKFKDGFGVAVTKLCDQVTSAPMVVRVKLHRTPMTKTQGVMPFSDPGITEHHVRALVNGGPVPEEEVESASAPLPVGFEDVKNTSTAEHTIVPLSDTEE